MTIFAADEAALSGSDPGTPKQVAESLRFLGRIGIDVAEDLRVAVATGAFDDAPNLPEVLIYLARRARHYRGAAPIAFVATLPVSASLSELSPFQASGPPPPALGLVGGRTSSKCETTMLTEGSAGWAEATAWVDGERRHKRYEGPNGREAVRFLTKDVPQWIAHHPQDVDEDDLREIARRLQERARAKGKTFVNNSIRTYFDYLGSYLKKRWKNHIVQDTGIRRDYPKKTTHTPTATPEEWESVMATAIGKECPVASLVWPNRRIEVRRAKVWDFHLKTGTWDARCKGGHGEVTDEGSTLTPTQIRVLETYLPWRRGLSRAPDILADTGYLITRRFRVQACSIQTRHTELLGYALVGVSDQTVNRLMQSAVARAFPDLETRPKLPGHSFRRGGLTTIHDRSMLQDGVPDWEGTKEMAHHQSLATTEGYVNSLLLKRRMTKVAGFLEPRKMGAR